MESSKGFTRETSAISIVRNQKTIFQNIIKKTVLDRITKNAWKVMKQTRLNLHCGMKQESNIILILEFSQDASHYKERNIIDVKI